jgi:hypothetical protein
MKSAGAPALVGVALAGEGEGALGGPVSICREPSTLCSRSRQQVAEHGALVVGQPWARSVSGAAAGALSRPAPTRV